MNIKVNRNSETAIYLQIKGAIINLIASKELVQGYKMPSERKLAEELSVHRNTVVKAYSELTAEGYLYASRQAPKGYFVKTPTSSESFSGRFFPLEKLIQYDFNEREKFFLDAFEQTQKRRDLISFAGLVMDKNAYPLEGLSEIIPNMFGSEEDETERLKKNICKLLTAENMYINTKNIQIVSETNQALSYLTDIFLHEGDCIIAEEPILPDNVSLIRHKNLELVTVPMEEDGMDMVALETLIHKHRPKFIYTMPNYHNPTGIVMSLEKRLRLLQIAQRHGIPIIEEDCLKDFSYSDNKIPSLYSLDKQKSVIYIYSFTLSFPLEIKTGYIVGPYDLAGIIERCITINETTVSNPCHYLLNEFIERGYYKKHIDWISNYYSQKLDLLCSELDKIRDKGIDFEYPHGGLLVWCQLDEEIKERQLFQIALDKGLLVMPGFLFFPYGYQGSGNLRLCFSRCSDDEIRQGVKILGEALDECRRKD